jgi:hypothetical protein
MPGDLGLCVPGLLLICFELPQRNHRVIEMIIIASQYLLVLAFTNYDTGVSPLRKLLSASTPPVSHNDNLPRNHRNARKSRSGGRRNRH